MIACWPFFLSKARWLPGYSIFAGSGLIEQRSLRANYTWLVSLGLLAVLAAQILIVALSTSLFIQGATKTPTTMTDILYLLTSVGFFGLMLGFIWACEKV